MGITGVNEEYLQGWIHNGYSWLVFFFYNNTE